MKVNLIKHGKENQHDRRMEKINKMCIGIIYIYMYYMKYEQPGMKRNTKYLR